MGKVKKFCGRVANHSRAQKRQPRHYEFAPTKTFAGDSDLRNLRQRSRIVRIPRGTTNPLPRLRGDQMSLNFEINGGSSGGGGTVTGVTATAPIVSSGGTAPDISMTNQGTTTTVLHGNASGNPAFSQIVNADITNSTIDLTAKVTGLLPVANAGVANAATANRDCVLLPWGEAQLNSSAVRNVMTANTMRVCQFKLDRIVVFTRVSINVTTTSNGNHEYIGIYDAAGTTLLRQASFTLGAGTGVLTATVSSTTLNPGVYWLGTSPDNATSVLAGTNTGASQAFTLYNGGSIVRFGTSSLSTSGGVMPASIGTVSALTSQMPLVLLEP